MKAIERTHTHEAGSRERVRFRYGEPGSHSTYAGERAHVDVFVRRGRVVIVRSDGGTLSVHPRTANVIEVE